MDKAIQDLSGVDGVTKKVGGEWLASMELCNAVQEQGLQNLRTQLDQFKEFFRNTCRQFYQNTEAAKVFLNLGDDVELTDAELHKLRENESGSLSEQRNECAALKRKLDFVPWTMPPVPSLDQIRWLRAYTASPIWLQVNGMSYVQYVFNVLVFK